VLSFVDNVLEHGKSFTPTLQAVKVPEALVYWQGHTYTGAGNVENSVSDLLKGSLFSLFALPSALMTASRIDVVFSYVASGCRDCTSRADVFGRRIPDSTAGFSDDIQPLLRAFDMALFQPKGTLPAGTRLEVRSLWKSRPISGFDCDGYDDEIDSWLLNAKLIGELACYSAQNVPDLSESLVVLSSFDFFQYIRLCAWKLECERALLAGIVWRNYQKHFVSTPSNGILTPLVVPRSILFWLLHLSVGLAHVAGTLPLTYRQQRVHEAFLLSGYLKTASSFGHPFGEIESRTIVLRDSSIFAGLRSFDMTELLESKKYATPFAILNMPDFLVANMNDLSRTEKLWLSNSYRQFLSFDITKATALQLQFQSIDNPSALHLQDDSGLLFLDSFSDNRSSCQDEFFVEIPLMKGSAKRVNDKMQKDFPTFSNISAPMETWFRRCLSLLGKEIIDVFTLRSPDRARVVASILAEASFLSGQYECVFWHSFWERVAVEEKADQKSLSFQGCTQTFSEKLCYLFLQLPEVKKNHPWMKSGAIQCFIGQKAQFQVQNESFFLRLLRRCLKITLLDKPLDSVEFCFPIFDSKRRRTDRFWIFKFKQTKSKGKGSKKAKKTQESSSDEEIIWE
jgi:hypothetical protein